MTCCGVSAELAVERERTAGARLSEEEVKLSSRSLGNGLRQTDLSVPGVHCGACIRTIESALAKLDGVESARVNLSTKRVSVCWREESQPPVVATLGRLGYAAHLFDDTSAGKDSTLTELIRALAISGFAAANIMLLSVSVWSGAEGATRDLFHWVSALIAVPAFAFAGRIYFRSAWEALSNGRMNMDVPIALGISLAYGMSLYETITHGEHAYFDAAVSLLFFLLIGRTLDHVMRDRARAAVTGLARLAPRGAMVVQADGSRDYLPVAELQPGMEIIVSAGERIPVDGIVRSGTSELDCAIVTGESTPRPAAPGEAVQAGTLNLLQPLMIEATAASKDSFLAEIVRLMESAEGGRARYRRIADRASALYSPVVHLTAFCTFLAWLTISGDWHRALTIAIAVLIITCPCALGLAVPIVQVVAARRLFEKGIMVKDGSAMERLAEIDTVVFDKTGTLTIGTPRVTNLAEIAPSALATAAAIAAHSRHPLSRAILSAGRTVDTVPFESIAEIPGRGLEAIRAGDVYRLGRPDWAFAAVAKEALVGSTVLSLNGVLLATFEFEDRLRPDAASAVAQLKAAGLTVEIISGDASAAVASVAEALSVDLAYAQVPPGSKVERLAELSSRGRKVLMVGDGLNDAPALIAAHVSIAPATAADIGRNAADFVFLHDSLSAVPIALEVSRRSGRLIRENLVLAVGYNAIAVPIAILGHVTPLIAAIAMSTSSLIVIGNAMRLLSSRGKKVETDRRADASFPLPAVAS
ncbi:cation-translocating P-type ATPase [Mesorhizobium sp. BAC0120]|uniref:cation-translocating P-type ATPase n=1 Tax=Mesorhizobium sp. BAC0120 TaxID=3090670 RepID=UPI00298C0939|nr:cation-translocating P-type ATPase [Mesorhizobium sp. BAC0120]MDW6024818.1 cation-translocating P-type ATPase [Mesorhizobium sp. BAC0120]